MSISVICPFCEHRFRIPEHAAGKTCFCSKCGQSTSVPSMNLLLNKDVQNGSFYLSGGGNRLRESSRKYNLSPCKHCGRSLASTAKQCPQCGGLTNHESNLSRTSIILSCIGFVCFGVFLAPIALVIAIVALSKGESNAVGALVLAIVSFIFSVCLFMFAMSLQV